MKKSIMVLLAVLSVLVLLLAACGGGGNAADTTEDKVPDQYVNQTNPLNGKADAIAAGKVVFETNCASCHGESGKGDGPAGAALNPKPADLSEPAANDTDGQFLWHVSEGSAAGEPGSAMPAWKGTLSQDQIWQVIAYIRTMK
jgi:mono/diheme cytochrome c family protein